MADRLLTIGQAAERMGLTPAQVSYRCDTHQIRFTRPRKHRLIFESDCDRYIAELRKGRSEVVPSLVTWRKAS